MSDLEARSGPKTLLKLLLSKTNDVLEQTKTNTREIELLKAKQVDTIDKLILLINQLELVTGEVNYGPN